MSMQRHQTSLEISAPVPPEIDAGASIMLSIAVSCPFGCDLRGKSVQISCGGVMVTTDLDRWEDGRNATWSCVLTTPNDLGEHICSIQFPMQDGAFQFAAILQVDDIIYFVCFLFFLRKNKASEKTKYK